MQNLWRSFFWKTKPTSTPEVRVCGSSFTQSQPGSVDLLDLLLLDLSPSWRVRVVDMQEVTMETQFFVSWVVDVQEVTMETVLLEGEDGGHAGGDYGNTVLRVLD
ncbi:hypothetical protein ACOMHN_025287 [Nucella lapillus]